MIDLHCHILPGMDDGAAMMDDALEMAHMAALSGVRTVVATPHCNRPGDPDDNFTGQELTDRLQGLRSALQAAQAVLLSCAISFIQRGYKCSVLTYP